MSRPFEQDPERDLWLGDALRVADDLHAEPDWDRLGRSVKQRAQAPLARLRRQQLPWWELAAQWTRPLVPLALAAGVTAVALLGPAGSGWGPGRTGADSTAVARVPLAPVGAETEALAILLGETTEAMLLDDFPLDRLELQ